MRNIENITLENWLGSSETKKAHKPGIHFAIKNSEVSIDFHLRQFFRREEISFHYFDDFSDLKRICLRHPVDAILIAGKSTFLRELELVRAIKANIILSIVPVILYNPDPPSDVVIAAYENYVEDFIYGEWVEKLVEVRIRAVIERSRRDLSVNPSTRLPGPAMIEREVERQIAIGEEFAVCYCDLDNFKAYNDYYGYASGDKIIKLLGRLLKDVVYDYCPEGFVGHIAGDDFICVIPREMVETTCERIISTFDAIIPYRYAEVDRDRGYIVTENRRGEREEYGILSISIAVVLNEKGKFEHIGEMSKMLADLKKATKAKDGSNYMIERRKKY